MSSPEHRCIVCGTLFPEHTHSHRKYCSGKCKARWRKQHGAAGPVTKHNCRMCGVEFKIDSSQGNKWLCSPACRRASVAKAAREFGVRRPERVAQYRSTYRSKRPPDSNNTRFYRNNPEAPRACQVCGEDRVVDIAHRPEHARLGERRTVSNCKWPTMVWVLCPTHHALIDRMHYHPSELGLK